MRNHPFPRPLRRLLPALLYPALLALQPHPALAVDTEGNARLFEDAQQRFSEEKYQGAIVQLRNILQDDPLNLPARTLLGRAHLQMHAAAAAEKELLLALKGGADPDLIRVPLATAYLEQRKFNELLDNVNTDGKNAEIDGEILILRGKAYKFLNRATDAGMAFAMAASLLPNSAIPQLEQARLALAGGDRRKAEDLVDIATGLEPGNGDAWELKGIIHQAQRDMEPAVGYYAKAIQLNPRLLGAHISRATVLFALGRDREAREDVRAVLEERPDSPEANFLMALLLARAKDMDGARQSLQAAQDTLLRINPDFLKLNPPLLLMAGMVKFADNAFAEAKKDLLEYLQYDADSVVAHKLLGAILLRENNAEAAYNTLRPALDRAPGDPQLQYLLGKAALGRKQYLVANQWFEKALAQGGDPAEILPDLARGRLANGQVEQAIKDLETIRARDPKNADTLALLGYVYMQRREYGKAIAALDAGDDATRPPAILNLAGLAQLGNGDAKAARARFERALAKDANFGPARLNLARMYLDEGDSTMASAQAQLILDKTPDDTGALALLADVAERDRRFMEAIPLLEKIKAADPANLPAQLRLTDLYIQARQLDKAQQVVAALGKKYPSNAQVLAAEGRLYLLLAQPEKAAKSFRSAAAFLSNTAQNTPDADKTDFAQRLVQVAQLQAQARDFEGGRNTLASAIQLAPDFVAAQTALVFLEREAGKLEQALERAAHILEKYPKTPMAAVLYGDLLMQAGRPAEALKAYTREQEREPSPMLVLRLYQAKRKVQGEGEAIGFLERWLQAHPDDLQVAQSLALAHLEAGRVDQARERFEQLVAAHPKDASLLNDLAWVYLQAGDPRAKTLAEQAYELAPGDISVLDTLGWILIREGQPALSLKYLRQGYVLDSKEPRIRYHLAVALSRLGRKTEARQELAEVLKLSNDFEGVADAKALLQELSAP